MVDSSNKERMEESHAELVKLMTEKRLSDALLLVYANKQVSIVNIEIFRACSHFKWKRDMTKRYLGNKMP